MFLILPTAKGDYCVNILKALFFYPHKELTRFEMEDGTIIDFNLKFEEVVNLVNEAGVEIPSCTPYEEN